MSEPEVPPGSRTWAMAQLRAGNSIRKVMWSVGPYYKLDAEENIRAHGIAGAEDFICEPAKVFEEAAEKWELHPPPPIISTLAGPIAWILLMFPRCGGPDALVAATEAMRAGGDADFARDLLLLWAAAGAPERGQRVVAVLAEIDRGVFRRSLMGDPGASAVILRALTGALNYRALPEDERTWEGQKR